ncbi:protein phosphatase 2C domain-containing protein [Streptomyces sp. NPDC001135]
MSQQGGRPARPEDDWWGQLYDDSTEDTGPTAAPDSLDDRFASAKRTVTGRPVTAPSGEPGPGTRAAADAAGSADAPDRGDTSGSTPPGRTALPPQRTPWEPPPPHREPPSSTNRRPPAPPTEPPARNPSAPTTPPPRSQDPSPPAADTAPEQRPPAAPSTHRSEGDVSAPPSPMEPRMPLAPAAPWQPQDLPAPRERTTQDPSPAPPADWSGDVSGPASVPGSRDLPVASSASADRGAQEGSSASPAGWSGRDAAEPDPCARTQGPPESVSPPEPLDTPTRLSSSQAPEKPPAGAGAHPSEPAASASPAASAASPTSSPLTPPPAPSCLDYVGSGPPTYDPEPTALPAADPEGLGELVADTVLDGARYGACALRAVSLRGDSARYRGEPRRDSLLTARFGTGEQALVLVAMATGVRGTPGAHLVAAEACRWIGWAVGRSHHRLVADIRAARCGDLRAGLHRLTDRSLGKLRVSAAERGVDPEKCTPSLRCLLLPADPDCRTRVFFGVGDGGLFRLRDGQWHDIEPRVTSDDSGGASAVGPGSPPGKPAKTCAETPEGDRLTMDLGIPTPPSPYEPAPEPPREPFRFRASAARPGDALVMCTAGLADPLRGEAALCAYLARRWSGPTAPGLAAFLADAQVRVKGYADDRTAAAVWEA